MPSRRAAFLVFAMCAAPRLAALAIFSPVQTVYYELSESLLREGRLAMDGEPTTYLEPLYPSFLAGARLLTFDSAPLTLALQIAVASLAGVVLYQLAARLAGPRAGMATAVLYAGYPYFIRQSGTYLAIPLTVTLAIAVTSQLVTSRSVRETALAGVTFGLLLLERAAFGPMWLAAVAWLFWRGRRRHALVLLVTALAVQAPWMWRTWRIDGGLLPSRLGENLAMTASPYSARVPEIDVDLLVPLLDEEARLEIDTAQLPPRDVQRAIDRVMLRRALTHIREHPGAFLRLKARNALALLDPRLLPRYTKSRDTRASVEDGRLRLENLQRRPFIEEAAHFVATALVLVLAAYGLWSRRPDRAEEPLLILAGSVAVTCVVFFPTTRLMAPAFIVPMFYAGVGVDALWARVTLVRATSATAPPRP